jgi:molybdate transport system substrate-binding protein
MSNSRMKKLALGLSGALAMMCSPADAQTKIVIATDNAFFNQTNDIVATIQAYYFTIHNLSYDAPIVATDSPQLAANIIAGTFHPDLFISAGPKQVEDLKRHHPELVVGEPFAVAVDSLELYSVTTDISAGLPFPLTTQIVIPYPPDDTYGVAAAEILEQRPWRIPTSSLPLPRAPTGGLVATEPDALITWAAINLGRFPYGFVAKSRVCTQPTLGADTFEDGSFHHEYKPFSRHHPYDPELVTVMAIRLAKTRTADQEAELKNFIAFLTGTKDTFGNVNISGTVIIQHSCFKLPDLDHHHGWESAENDDR